jgi:hypothetical protein
MAEAEVIKGLNWDVTGEVVMDLLHTRIEQCNQKEELFNKQAKAQEQLTEGMTNPEQEYAKFSTDQSENLRKKAQEYRERAKMYLFLHDHVVKSATYRLDRGDLEFLGVVRSRY